MSERNIVRLAWALCVLVIISAVVVTVLSMRDRPADATFLETVGTVATFTMFAAFAVTGALIISSQPRNMVGWLLMIEAALVFAWPLGIYFDNLAQAPANLSFLTMLGLWIYGWLWLWYIFPLLFIPLFFPTGRTLTSRWRWVVGLGLGLCAFFILFVTFSAEFFPQNESWSVPNPIGFLSVDSFPFPLWAVLLLSFAALSVSSLFVRYRRARIVEREQIKWLLYAAALFLLVYSISFVLSDLRDEFIDLVNLLLSFVILLLPAAIAIAILRYRLYDIDVIIRKTLVYAVLTGLLGLVYFGVVLLLQSILDSVSGQESPLVIVISTLVIAALFAPLRKRVQAVIDRRFFRKKYDTQQVLAQFARTARDEVSLEALTAELTHVVQESMQPEQVSLWFKQPGSDQFTD